MCQRVLLLLENVRLFLMRSKVKTSQEWFSACSSSDNPKISEMKKLIEYLQNGRFAQKKKRKSSFFCWVISFHDTVTYW